MQPSTFYRYSPPVSKASKKLAPFELVKKKKKKKKREKTVTRYEQVC